MGELVLYDYDHAPGPRRVRLLPRLEAQLADHEFVAADRFLLPNMTLLAALDFSRHMLPELPPDLARWYEAAKAAERQGVRVSGSRALARQTDRCSRDSAGTAVGPH